MQIGIVMLENTGLSGVTSAAAPYLFGLYNNGAYVKVTNYTVRCKPSYPNYMSITAGTTFANCSDTVTARSGVNNIFSQIEAAGHTWKTYEEGGSLVGSPYQGDNQSSWPYYVRRHNPAQTFSQVTHSHNRVDFIDAKAADGVAAKGLVSDITNKALPDFFMITPNIINDGHSPGSITTADKWCSGHTTVAQSAPFPGILALAAAMRNDGFLVIAFDENGLPTTPLYCLVLPGGTSSLASTADFTAATGHFGLLKGIQDAFGLSRWTTTGGAGTLDTRYTGDTPDAPVTVFAGVVVGDTTAPTAPSALRTTSVGVTNVGLAWTASSDPDNAASVLTYQILRNGAVVGTTPAGATTFTDGGLTGSTPYTYTVKAIDPAGNVSLVSSPLSVTTSSPVAGARVHLGTPIHVYAKSAITAAQATALGNAYDVITVGGPADISNLQSTIQAAGAVLGWYNKGATAPGPSNFIDAWYAHGAGGAKVGPNTFNQYVMQVDDTTSAVVAGVSYSGWKPYHAQQVKDLSASIGAAFTAPFIDSLGDFNRCVGGVCAVAPGTGTPYTPQTYASMVWQVVPAIRAKLGTSSPWLVIVNGMESTNQAQWTKADVLMNEGWFGGPSNPIGSHPSWHAGVQMAMDCAALGVQPWLYIKVANASFTATLRSQLRGYGCASYFIAYDQTTPALFELGPSEGGPAPQVQSPLEYTQPEYAAVIGSPTETFTSVDGYWKGSGTPGPGIYGRYFTKGVALVNTDTAPHTYTLTGSGWKTVTGVALASLTVTVPAQSGVIYTGTPSATGPAVTLGAPTGVGSTTATLHGTVDPNGAATTCFFEYGTTTAYGSQSATQTIPVGTNPVAVTANLTGLPAGTVIHYRLTAQNTNGTAHSADATFTTTGVAVPAVTTTPESNLTETSVTLNGTVDPNNLATTYFFEYGEDTTYGLREPQAFDHWILTRGVLAQVDLIDTALAHQWFDTPGTYTIGDTPLAGYTNLNPTRSYKDFYQFYLDLTGSNYPGYAGPALIRSAIPATVEAVLYDLENWGDTPPSTPDDQQRDPERFMGLFQQYANQASTYIGRRLDVLTAPGRTLYLASTRPGNLTPLCYVGSSGVTGETLTQAWERCGPGSAATGYNGFSIQSQAEQGTLSNYTAMVQSGRDLARTAQPGITVTAGLSTGLAQGELTGAQLYAAAQTVQGIADGFWLNAAQDATHAQYLVDFLRLLPAAGASAGSGGSPVTVHADLTGLTPGITYHYRLVASNSAGPAASPDAIFGTPSAPVVTVDPVTPTQTDATLAGTIDPNGTAVTYHFVYGRTTAYGSVTPNQSIAAGEVNPVDVFAPITGLQPNTTYHFALIANGVHSGDGVFTTLAVTTITEAYLWQTSADSGATWQAAANAANTNQSYDVAAGDQGKLLRCAVTASDGQGHTTRIFTTPVGPISAAGSGIIYHYQWQNSADQSNWGSAAGVGANSSVYVVDPTDATLWLRCLVTAINSFGSNQMPSNVLGPIPAGGGNTLIAQDSITVDVSPGGNTLVAQDSITVDVQSSGGGGYAEPWAVGTKIPAWIRLDNVEIANWARTSEYLARGLAGPDLHLQEPCGCGFLYRVDGSRQTFVSPAADPAPWYDPQRPESTQFLGLVVNNIQNDPVTTHAVADLVGPFGGSVLSPAQTIGRRLTVSGTIAASSCAGRDYGLEWLADRLGDPACDSCALSTIEYREVCPPSDGSYDDMGYWIAYQAGITAGPTPGAADNLCNLTDVSWTWVSEKGYLYKPPETIIPSTILAPPSTGGCMDFVDWFCGAGGGLKCATINPPVAGAWSAIITINSPDGVGGIDIASYARCPPNLATDLPDRLMRVSRLQGTLIIDSALQMITYISEDNSVVMDGTGFIDVPVGEQLEWVTVEECDPARCICFSQSHPCSGGEQTTITVELQYRRR